MSILLPVIVLFALLSGGLAAGQAIAISRMATVSGPTLKDWLFGWWHFERISSWAGLTGEVQAAIYKRAVIVCLVFIILGLILSGWVVSQRGAAGGVSTAAISNDRRVLPADFAEQFELRRVAPMPGATNLES